MVSAAHTDTHTHHQGVYVYRLLCEGTHTKQMPSNLMCVVVLSRVLWGQGAVGTLLLPPALIWIYTASSELLRIGLNLHSQL